MQQDTIKGIQWVSVGSIIIGIIFIVAGAIISGIAYTEITPPNYDENYDRYIGSSVPRLMGPFILFFGLFIILGSCSIMGYSTMRQYQPLPKHKPVPVTQDYKEQEYDPSYHSKMTP